MKTLYVSDLDGTLLRRDQTLSRYTLETLNGLIGEGMHFAYATARSAITARKVTQGLALRVPFVVYNGAFVLDGGSGEVLLENYFPDNGREILERLLGEGIYPTVYSIRAGRECMAFLPEHVTRGMKHFLDSRLGDPRWTELQDARQLLEGAVFYILCVDEEDRLFPLYQAYRDRVHCVYQKDIYSGEQWLEFLPAEANKANAVRRLKELLACEKLVVFGDGNNDLELFEIADECYAVSNAVEGLKAIATGVIGSNEEDGVAHWLEKNAEY